MTDENLHSGEFFDFTAMLFSKDPVPPKQSKRNSRNRQFESFISNLHLDFAPEPKTFPQNEWPWKGRLLVVLTFSGPNDFLRQADVDNLSKAVLDAYKKIAYDDDSQVDVLIARKNYTPLSEYVSFTIQIKKIQENYLPDFINFPLVKTDTQHQGNSPAIIVYENQAGERIQHTVASNDNEALSRAFEDVYTNIKRPAK